MSNGYPVTAEDINNWGDVEIPHQYIRKKEKY